MEINSAAIVGLLCGLRGKPHRELAEWTRAPAAFLEMSELPSTYLLKLYGRFPKGKKKDQNMMRRGYSFHNGIDLYEQHTTKRDLTC